jgi:hypothetical protein
MKYIVDAKLIHPCSNVSCISAESVKSQLVLLVYLVHPRQILSSPVSKFLAGVKYSKNMGSGRGPWDGATPRDGATGQMGLCHAAGKQQRRRLPTASLSTCVSYVLKLGTDEALGAPEAQVLWGSKTRQFTKSFDNDKSTSYSRSFGRQDVVLKRGTGTQFTCLTSTKVHMLTHEALGAFAVRGTRWK